MPYTNEGKKPAVEVIIEMIEKAVNDMLPLLSIQIGPHWAQRNILGLLLRMLDQTVIPLEQLPLVNARMAKVFALVSGYTCHDDIAKMFGDLERFIPSEGNVPTRLAKELEQSGLFEDAPQLGR